MAPREMKPGGLGVILPAAVLLTVAMVVAVVLATLLLSTEAAQPGRTGRGSGEALGRVPDRPHTQSCHHPSDVI